MAIITQTIHQDPKSLASEPRQLSLLLKEKASDFQGEKFILDLAKILDTFENWNDPFSKKLFLWCAKLISADELNDEKRALPHIRIRLVKLFNKFKNPCFSIGPKTIEDPVLEKNQLWDRETLKVFQTRFAFSPLDNLPWGTVKDHSFAKAVLVWAKSLPAECYDQVQEKAEFVPFNEERQVSTFSLSSLKPGMQEAYLYQIASLATATLRSRAQEKKQNRFTKFLELDQEKQDKINRQDALLEQQKALAHENKVRSEVKDIKDTFETHLETLHENLQEAYEMMGQVQASLKLKEQDFAELEKSAQEGRDKLKHLEETFNEKLVDKASELTNNNLNDLKTIYESDKSSLQNQINATRQQVQDAERRLNTANQGRIQDQNTISNLASRIQSLEAKIQSQAEILAPGKKHKGHCEVQ